MIRIFTIIAQNWQDWDFKRSSTQPMLFSDLLPNLALAAERKKTAPAEEPVRGAMDCIVLDAMGVVFRAADDVVELLIPFIAEAGGTGDTRKIESSYLDASLGIINADEFWRRVDLNPSVEDAYLSRHSLIPGADEFLRDSKRRKIPVWCLSNDVARWSRKLRTAFRLDELLAGAVISGEIGVRKPDGAIYECLLERSGYRADQLLFVDDRTKNVEAAAAMGIRSVLFGPETGYDAVRRQVFKRTH